MKNELTESNKKIIKTNELFIYTALGEEGPKRRVGYGEKE